MDKKAAIKADRAAKDETMSRTSEVKKARPQTAVARKTENLDDLKSQKSYNSRVSRPPSHRPSAAAAPSEKQQKRPQNDAKSVGKQSSVITPSVKKEDSDSDVEEEDEWTAI